MNIGVFDNKVQDVSKRKLIVMEERYQTILEQTNLITYDIDLRSGETYVSDNFIRETGIVHNSRMILKQMLNLSVIHPDDIDIFKAYIRQVIPGQLKDIATYRRKKLDGSYAWLRSSRKNVFDENGKLIRVLGVVQDVSAEMNAYEEMKKRVERDSLTGIYNMTSFSSEASKVLLKHKDKNYAIIVFDIDKFRVINDLYGLEEGNKILKHIGQVLERHIHKPNLFCRMYADSFSVLFEYQKQSDIEKMIEGIADDIYHHSVKAIQLDGMLSFGICKVEDYKTPIITLCDCASLAKKNIKGNVIHLIAYYDEALRQKGIDDKDIENEMSSALLEHQFEMYLQPKVSICSSDVVGAEALVRWNHPKRGVISPDRFIPLFEQNGFIVKLDYYIWEEAFATIHRWLKEGYTPVPISVNVSRVHIYNMDILTVLVNLSKKYKVPTHYIELELTETTYFNNFDKLSKLVLDLKKEGFTLSIDDFGSGYTSLNMLKDIPIDVIKIDKGFMNEIVGTERGKTVIRYTIAMAKQLNIDVIAEGVEDFSQVEFLYEAGCEIAQGYFYSKPLPIYKFESYTYGNYYKMQVL